MDLSSFKEKDIPCSSHDGSKTTGAYILEHGSGKLYVGSTNDLYRREVQHRHRLKVGTHNNKPLQAAYNLDPNYVCKVIVTDSREDALKIEQDIIDQYIDSGSLFNVAPDATVSSRGVARSEEHRKRIAEAHRDIPHTEEHNRKIMFGNPKRTEVSINGVEFPSIRAAGRALGIHDQTVSRRVNSHEPKYVDWRWIDDADPDFVIMCE